MITNNAPEYRGAKGKKAHLALGLKIIHLKNTGSKQASIFNSLSD
ncbi:hypothetical protein VCHA39O220_90148 [Vibrio chagasii]|nr:hypothetical protein VCHA35O135_110105 [Vibrio chagasii]CAH6921357.1 hypothetical protein VCHA48P434_110051 [Vibrio chagasii]CAH7000832.1 hypothetical protein VCHA51O444_120161 [Vibrio chagasii]CAH7010684.1 hypothetical protein VCHA56P515_170052 [Vibrio chagasii]CAH7061064.1 hypothetical protein VCHA53O463_170066 [Vibrio chagasii]